MAQQAQRKSGGDRKHGRNKRKKASRMKPLSRFVRNRISFEQYYKLEFGKKLVG